MEKSKNKFWKIIKKIPWYGWVSGIVLFGLQYGLYRFAHALSVWTTTIKWEWLPKTSLDNKIPLVPFFAIFYLFSYVFWICGPIAASMTNKDNFINFLFVILISYMIGFFIFWLSPTYMDREAEGLLEITQNKGVFHWLLNLVYSSDGDSKAYNLFPSYHCLISLCCYLGVCRRKEIHIGFRIYSLVMVILIMLSTVFTKQHYIIDIFGGTAISLITYFVIKLINPGKTILERRQKIKNS